MNDSTKTSQIGEIQLSEPELQALSTLAFSSRTRYKFREQMHKLAHRIKNPTKTDSILSPLEAEATARIWLEAAGAAENAGEMSPSHRFFIRVSAIEQVHNNRVLDGFYDKDLAAITICMDAILQREGLDEEEWWPKGEGPADWEELDDQYSQLLYMKFEDTLREFGLNDIADLYHTDRDAFKSSREEGRRLFFESISEQEKLRTLQQQYETEASICAQNEAFHAAAAMIGSAMETVLLLACINHRDSAVKALTHLSDSKRFKSKNPEKWTFNQLVMIVDEAGWLPDFEVGDETISSYRLTDMVRQLRNMLHPACYLSDGHKLDIERKYLNAQATYVFLKQHLVEAWTS